MYLKEFHLSNGESIVLMESFTLRWVLTKLYHLPQTHTGCRKGAVMRDGVHQRFGWLPHLLNPASRLRR
jgi:hypothetical protein